jgi:hypothetical protein
MMIRSVVRVAFSSNEVRKSVRDGSPPSPSVVGTMRIVGEGKLREIFNRSTCGIVVTFTTFVTKKTV